MVSQGRFSCILYLVHVVLKDGTTDVIELQEKEPSVQPTAATEKKKSTGIKLTLTSNTKSNIAKEKRQQNKRARLEAKKERDNVVESNDSDSD